MAVKKSEPHFSIMRIAPFLINELRVRVFSLIYREKSRQKREKWKEGQSLVSDSSKLAISSKHIQLVIGVSLHITEGHQGLKHIWKTSL